MTPAGHCGAKPSVAIAILAAGRSSRMQDANKLLLPYKGKTILEHGVHEALGAGCSDVFVITGHDRGLVEKVAQRHGVETFHNEDYASGMSSSVKKAVSSVPAHCDGVLIVLGDMPAITNSVLKQIIAAFNPQEGRDLILPTHDGKKGNPVLWGRRYFDSFNKLQGDAGAKILFDEFSQNIVAIDVGTDAVFMDIDTTEAYQLFKKMEK